MYNMQNMMCLVSIMMILKTLEQMAGISPNWNRCSMLLTIPDEDPPARGLVLLPTIHSRANLGASVAPVSTGSNMFPLIG